MGHIVPLAMLARAGVPLSQLERHDYLNSHNDVALAVLGGYFDAVGMKDEIFAEYENRGLRALATSEPMPDHLFLARSNLPATSSEASSVLSPLLTNTPCKRRWSSMTNIFSP